MSDCHLRFCLAVVALTLGLAACGSASKPPEGAVASSSAVRVADAVVPVAAETQAVAGSQPNDAAIWLHPTDPSKSVVLGASGEGGLEVYSLDGKRIASYPDALLDYIAVSAAFPLRAGLQPLVVGYDRKEGALVAFTVDPASLRVSRASAQSIKIDSEVTGLCAYRSPRTGRHYAFATTDDGNIQQWELFEKAGKVSAGIVRALPFGAGIGYCYVTEETVGIWRLSAEPESDAERELIDAIGDRGHLKEEVKGIAFFPVDTKGGYLLAADVAAGRINVYSASESKILGSFTLRTPPEAAALKEAEGLAAAGMNLGPAMPEGMLVVADRSADAAAASFRFLSWSGVAEALKLERAAKAAPPAAAPPTARNVMPSIETEPVDDYGDAADDPAIWVHPTDASRSVIVGAQKKRGLYVYDLSGKTLQVVPDGRMNNVDLRQGFKLGGASVAIVAASNRTTRTLALYKLDAATRRLVEIAAEPIPTGFNDPYGLCMYRSAGTGDLYVFMNDADNGAYKQWRLVPRGDKVAAEVVREFTVGTQAEGCAADDDTGALYIAEEDVGLWRYEAEPSGADRRTALDNTTDKGHLAADVEGVAIYYGANGTGYVIVSNQGNDNYAVYRREGGNEFLGRFSVIADPSRGIDGASETDGLDVIGTPLGAAFPYGVFVAQDGRNIAPRERQNFKLVPWERVADVMSLQKFTGRNPASGPQ
jgi:3-phytase